MRKSSAETQPLSVRPTRSNRACGHPRAGTSRARAREREREREKKDQGARGGTAHTARSAYDPAHHGTPRHEWQRQRQRHGQVCVRRRAAVLRARARARTPACARSREILDRTARGSRARRARARAARSAPYGGTHRHGSAGRDAQPMPSTHTLAPTVDTRPLAHDRRARSEARTRPSRPTGARTSAMLRMTRGRFLPVRSHARTRTRLQHTIAAATYARRC